METKMVTITVPADALGIYQTMFIMLASSGQIALKLASDESIQRVKVIFDEFASALDKAKQNPDEAKAVIVGMSIEEFRQLQDDPQGMAKMTRRVMQMRGVPTEMIDAQMNRAGMKIGKETIQ
jgi:hypothetical protein